MRKKEGPLTNIFFYKTNNHNRKSEDWRRSEDSRKSTQRERIGGARREKRTGKKEHPRQDDEDDEGSGDERKTTTTSSNTTVLLDELHRGGKHSQLTVSIYTRVCTRREETITVGIYYYVHLMLLKSPRNWSELSTIKPYKTRRIL